MIKGTEDTRYAFVNGIIRSREARLLTKGHFDRLIAADLDNFNSIISDSPYVGHDSLPAGLEDETNQVGAFFDRYCQTPEVRNFIDWPKQMHNLKVRLKKGGDELLYPQTEAAAETWPEVIEEVGRFALDKNPFILSTGLDRILCRYLYSMAGFTPFFINYYKLYFDLENVRSFFRSRQFEDKEKILDRVFIEYGSVEKDLFVECLGVKADQLARRFYNTPYGALLEQGGVYLEQNHSFLRLERLCEEMRMRFLRQTRMMTFGIEPLFGYYEFKMAEIRKLRQVYWGKVNGIANETMKESIPDVW